MADHARHMGKPKGMSNPEKPPVGKAAAILLVAFLLQVIVAPNISIGSTAPNFLFLGGVVVSTFASQRFSTIMGFVFGLIFDLLGGGPVGAMALIMSITGFVFPLLADSMSIDNIGSWLIAFAVTALIANSVYTIIMVIIAHASFFSSLLHVLLPWTVYEAVIGVFGWPFVPHGSKSKQSAKANTKIKL